MVNTQTVMTKPPEVLTGKDLTYIEDAMSWELLAMKKCALFQLVSGPRSEKPIRRSGSDASSPLC